MDLLDLLSEGPDAGSAGSAGSAPPASGDYRGYLAQRASEMGIPEGIASRMMSTESGGRIDALSPKGARGLMQVMPGTAREMGFDPDRMTPEQNIDAGLGYLKKQYDRFGDWRQAVAAYHAGPGAVAKAGGIPNTSDGIMRTADYVNRIAGDEGGEGGEPSKPRTLLDLLGEGQGPSDAQARRTALSQAIEEGRAATEKASKQGLVNHLTAGLKTPFMQIPELGYGLVGLGASVFETTLGAGGMATAARKWAAEGAKSWGADIARITPENAEFDQVVAKAKNGDVGALADWFSYALGYGLGQAAQLVGTAGVGALAGKAGIRLAAEGMAKKAIAEEAAELAAKEGVTQVTEALTQQAARNVAAKIGANAAVAAQAFGMEAGEIGGELSAKNLDRPLTGAELVRATGAILGAGALEFVGDKLGLAAVHNKIASGVGNRALRMGLGGTVAAIGEAATEYPQTLAEEFGKGNDPFSPESLRQAGNAAALAAVGGGAVGVIGGIPKPAVPTPDRIIREIDSAQNLDDVGRAAAKLHDEALAALKSATDEYVGVSDEATRTTTALKAVDDILAQNEQQAAQAQQQLVDLETMNAGVPGAQGLINQAGQPPESSAIAPAQPSAIAPASAIEQPAAPGPNIPALRTMVDQQAAGEAQAQQRAAGVLPTLAPAAHPPQPEPAPEQAGVEIIDRRPLTMQQAKQRLAVLRDGGDERVVAVANPGYPGKFAIGRLPEPSAGLPEPDQAAQPSAAAGQARLESADLAGQLAQRRAADGGRMTMVNRALQAIEARGGAATPAEARTVQQAGLGKPWDRLVADEGSPTPDQASTIQVERQGGRPGERVVQRANEQQAESDARMARRAAPAPAPAKMPSGRAAPSVDSVLAALAANAPVRTTAQRLTVAAARAAYGNDFAALERAARNPGAMSAEDRLAVKRLREAEGKVAGSTERGAGNGPGEAVRTGAVPVRQAASQPQGEPVRGVPREPAAGVAGPAEGGREEAQRSSGSTRGTSDAGAGAGSQPAGRAAARTADDVSGEVREAGGDRGVPVSGVRERGQAAPDFEGAGREAFRRLSGKESASFKLVGKGLSRAAQVVQQVARVFGKQVGFFTTDAKGYDGFYDPAQPDVIYLRADATGINPMAVLGHELLHALKRDNPEIYQRLVSVVQQSSTDQTAAQHLADYGDTSNIEELTADLFGNRFTETEFWSDVMGGLEPGLMKRLVDAITRVINTIIEAVKGEKFAADTFVRDLEKVRAAVTEAAKAYREARRSETAIDRAAHEAATSPRNDASQPTPKMKEAGNYLKGHLRVAGLDISIENPANTIRNPDWPRLKDHYGYILGTIGKDKDHIDAFIVPGTPEDWSGPVFVVDQRLKGRFDEHKVILGAATLAEAREAYLRNYEPGWPGLGAITQTTIKAFRGWLENGDTARPFASNPANRFGIKASRSRYPNELSAALRLATGQKWQRGRDLKAALQQLAKESGQELRDPAYLKRIGVRDAKAALEQNPNALGWYDKKTRQALAVVSLIHPEVATDPQAKLAFVWAMAVTSNGLKVDKNFEIAERAYRHYRDTGEMPTNVGIGTAGDAINKGLQLFNDLKKEVGFADLLRFMRSDFKVSEINRLDLGVKVSDELVDTVLPGAVVLGPKIGGGFFSNLYGRFDQLTMDRWLVRTWGRWTGTLLREGADVEANTAAAEKRLRQAVAALSPQEKLRHQQLLGKLSGPDLAARISDVSEDPALRKKLDDELRRAGNSLARWYDAQKEAPANGAERAEIRGIFQDILTEIRKEPAYNGMEMADLQAVLWYAEKRLYEAAKVDAEAGPVEGYEDSEAPDYANAAAKLARAQGVDEKLIQSTLKESSRGRAKAAGPGAGKVRGAQAGAQGADERFAERDRRTFISERAQLGVRRSAGVGDEGLSWAYSRGSAGDGGRARVLKSLGATYTAAWSPGLRLANAFKAAGLAAPKFYELAANDERNANRFVEAITYAKNTMGPMGAAVYVYPAADYQGFRLFLSENGKAGVAIKPDGDIVSVFSAERGSGRAVMDLAVAAGGLKLDAFDTILPRFYAAHGFKAVARLSWDESQAPDGWDKQAFAKYNNGRPDVVFMVYDPAKTDARYERTDGTRFREYDDALAAQQAAMAPRASTARRAQTESPAFKRWFAGSKVVNDDGSPMVMYHGTTADFEAFDPKRGKLGQRGLYFTSSPSLAGIYSDVTQAAGANVMPVYLAIKNPLDLNRSSIDWSSLRGRLTRMLLPKRLIDRIQQFEQFRADLQLGSFFSDDDVARLKAAGFDGVMTADGTVAIAFDPTQIKSAIGNSGAFDPAKESVLASTARRAQTKTAEFKRWSGGADVVFLGENPGGAFQTGKPVVVEAVHGTLSDFERFKRGGNVNFIGSGIYASSEPEDVARNYASIRGPDFMFRLDRAMENIRDDLNEEPGESQEDFEARVKEAAMEELQVEHRGFTMPIFMRFENPAILDEHGGDQTQFRIDDDGQPDELLQKLYDAIDVVLDSGADRVKNRISDRVYDYGEIGLSDVRAVLVEANAEAYLGDDYAAGAEMLSTILQRMGFDGVIDNSAGQRWNMPGMDESTRHYVAFSPFQIKSSLGNRGKFDPDDARITASMSRERVAQKMADVRIANHELSQLRYHLTDAVKPQREFNVLHRTLATQYHKATVNPYFKKVFELGQTFLDDVTRFATRSEDKATMIFPRFGLPTWENLKKTGLSKVDNALVGRALTEGTLENGPNPHDGVVFTDAQLRDRFKMNDRQIAAYRQARAMIDQSLADLAKTEIAQHLRVNGADVQAAADLARSTASLQDVADQALSMLATIAERDGKDLSQAMTHVRGIASTTKNLQRAGYAPLMRFGKFTVTMTKPDGEVTFFRMFETRSEADAVARSMRADEEYAGQTVTTGSMNTDLHKLFNGVTSDTLELFANHAAEPLTDLMQEYLDLAVSNRSAMKRLINRKGTAGFSDDATRSLAQFVTSNARRGSKNINSTALSNAVMEIPKEQGLVQREATNLVDYLMNPPEENAKLRGLLFFQYLGGSIAAGLVNMTQPAMMTLPWLSQFKGLAKAGTAMASSLGKVGDAIRGKKMGDAELDAALSRAREAGVLDPQEIYQLMSAADKGASSLASHKFQRLWGSNFAITELFNRSLTFLAAFDVGRAMSAAQLQQAGVGDAYELAVKAIRETQGIYNKGNRPNWARGPVGATIFTFKQYSIAYVEFLRRLWGDKVLPRPAAVAALGMLILASGFSGLPGADDLDDLIDTVGNWMGFATNAKAWKHDVLREMVGDSTANFLLHGMSVLPFMPIDVQARMGLANLIPGTALLNPNKKEKVREVAEVAGVAGDAVMRAGEMVSAAAVGDWRRAALAQLPTAMRNLYQASEMARTGEYRDSLGKLVQRVTPVDVAAKAVGFQPPVVAAQYRNMREVQGYIDIVRNRQTEFNGRYARAMVDEDRAALERLREDITDWNTKNPDLPVQLNLSEIMSRVREMRASKIDRFVKAAPRSIRATVRSALEAEQ